MSSTCNQYKKLLMRYFTLLCAYQVFETWCAFTLAHISIRKATFQGLKGHVWLGATLLDHKGKGPEIALSCSPVLVGPEFSGHCSQAGDSLHQTSAPPQSLGPFNPSLPLPKSHLLLASLVFDIRPCLLVWTGCRTGALPILRAVHGVSGSQTGPGTVGTSKSNGILVGGDLILAGDTSTYIVLKD